MKHKSSEGNERSRSQPPNPHPIPNNGARENPLHFTADDSWRRKLELDGKNQPEGMADAAGAESVNEEGSAEEGDGEDKEEVEAAQLRVGAAAEHETEGERPKLAEGFYEVEAIRKKRIFKGEAQYLIKWRGWPESSNTWEPLEHLQLCPDVVEAFEKSLRSRKKTSRKRKRKFTQPKKKMYSCGHCGSEGRNAVMKKMRLVRKADENSQGEDPSQVLGGDSKRNGDSNSFGEAVGMRRITIQLQEPVKLGNEPVNSSSKNDNSEPSSQGDRPTGAKRRKSGSVRRFKPETVSPDLSNHMNSMPVGVSSCDRAEQLMAGSIEAYPKNKYKFLRDNSDITRIIKPVGYSTTISNSVQDVLVTFVAMRCDGQEVTVDNKFLKANNPLLLIDFYEQHLRYSTPTS